MMTVVFKPSILHPWSQQEETHLLALVKEQGRKGWLKIAERLGTNRTAASVSARWQRLTSLGLSSSFSRSSRGASPLTRKTQLLLNQTTLTTSSLVRSVTYPRLEKSKLTAHLFSSHDSQRQGSCHRAREQGQLVPLDHRRRL